MEIITKKQEETNSWFCGGNLRRKCLIIGYLNLFVSIIDITWHVVLVAIVSQGFQCDVTEDSLRVIDWPWVEPLFMIFNIGTHGIYPFPFVILSFYSIPYVYVDVRYPVDPYDMGWNRHEPIPRDPRCYPGMLHLYSLDVLNFVINVIWLSFVIAFVSAVYKKNLESIRTFFGVSLVKLVLQVMYFFTQPNYISGFHKGLYWLISLTDASIATISLIIIDAYMDQLRAEKNRKSYIDCLINGPQTMLDEKKDAVLFIEQKKPDVPVDPEPRERC